MNRALIVAAPLAAALTGGVWAMWLGANSRLQRWAGEPDPFSGLQRRMVQEQLAAPERGITDSRVLAVMALMPRHEFLPAHIRASAYEDCALPIGYGQTLSQPYIVAVMTERLEPQPSDRVLEIGTGSGYQAAILARLVQEVFTIEIIAPLANRAAATLKDLALTNVQVRSGDGYRGWLEAAPFDGIIVTCAPEQVPPSLVDQLREGGRMIIPVGEAGNQHLFLLRKQHGKLEQRLVLAVRFVPMTRAAQPPQ